MLFIVFLHILGNLYSLSNYKYERRNNNLKSISPTFLFSSEPNKCLQKCSKTAQKCTNATPIICLKECENSSKKGDCLKRCEFEG